MGSMLSFPVLTQFIERGGNKLCTCVVATAQGHRNTQEDAHNMITHMVMGGTPVMMFGVYDGHGGTDCAIYLQEHLPSKVRDLKIEDLENTTVMTKLYNTIDQAFIKEHKNHEHGSTCVVVFAYPVDATTEKPVVLPSQNSFVAPQDIPSKWTYDKGGMKNLPARPAPFTSEEEAALLSNIKYKLVAVNVGDSRAMVAYAKETDYKWYEPLTRDHKPSDHEERLRIQNAGGMVQNDRVDGSLALSRAFGDSNYKKANLPAHLQKVITTPTITTYYVQPGDLLVVTCDGVYEAMTEEDVDRIVREPHNSFKMVTNLQQDDDAILAMKLIFQSIDQGSRDNHTAIVVRFNEYSTRGEKYVAENFAKQYLPGPYTRINDSNFRDSYCDDIRDHGIDEKSALEDAVVHWESRNTEFMQSLKYMDSAEKSFGGGKGAMYKALEAASEPNFETLLYLLHGLDSTVDMDSFGHDYEYSEDSEGQEEDYEEEQ